MSKSWHCPQCGKFLKGVFAESTVDDQIRKVVGNCKTHGQVELTDWEWGDFFPEKEHQSEQISVM